MFDPERDADLVIRFAQDVGVAIMAYLALALWPLGEVDRARKIADETVARARRGDRETGVADLRQAWRHTPRPETNCTCHTSKVCSPSSKPRQKERTVR
jgi:hypothetical protein